MEKEIRSDVKGIDRFIFETGADQEQLHLHISEVGPGQRAHPPHTHEGQEIFTCFLGRARCYLAKRRIALETMKPFTSIAKFYMGYVMSVRRHSVTL